MAFIPHGYLADDEVEVAADPRVPEVKERILEHFREHEGDVFYERQLEVLFEDDYFHWLTARALRELEDEGRLASDLMTSNGEVLERDEAQREADLDRGGVPVVVEESDDGAEEVVFRFYRRRKPKLRSWKRKARAKLKVVREFVPLGKAMGKHTEVQFDGCFAGIGFKREAMNVREWAERRWTKSGHELDRVYSRDGVAYGAEIKNRLRYIQPREFYAKLDMCRELRLRPLFIVRMMPGDYIFKVFERGGFVIVFKYQMYPYGYGALAERVRLKLGFPTGTEIFMKTVERFEREGHLRILTEVKSAQRQGGEPA
jgi:hypothetical protein